MTVRTEDPRVRAILEQIDLNRGPLALDRTLVDCSECRWPRVKVFNGVPTGTVCEIDGVCWREEHRRITAEREAAKVPRHGYTRNNSPEGGVHGESE